MAVLRVGLALVVIFAPMLEAQQTVFFKADHIHDGNGRLVAVTGASTDQTPPTVPGSFGYSEMNPSAVRLDWLASTDTNGSGLGGYRIFRGGFLLATVGATTLFYRDTTVQPGTAYTYTVRAFDNALNESADSTAVNLTSPTNSAIDNFNRPDGPVGSSWTKPPGPLAGEIRSHAIGMESQFTSKRANGYSAMTFNADQYAQVYVSVLPRWTGGAAVRMQTSADSYYGAGFDNNNFSTSNGTEKCRIWRWLNGVITSLAVDPNCHVLQGDTLRLEVQGSTLRFYINGVLKLTSTDTALTSGNPGLEYIHNVNGSPVLDDWTGGNL